MFSLLLRCEWQGIQPLVVPPPHSEGRKVGRAESYWGRRKEVVRSTLGGGSRETETLPLTRFLPSKDLGSWVQAMQILQMMRKADVRCCQHCHLGTGTPGKNQEQQCPGRRSRCSTPGEDMASGCTH